MRRMLLVLKRSPEQEAALQKLLDDQQDKSSPTYHQWLTPEQFGQQFGPSDQDLHSVTSWLQSHGFEIVRTAKGRGVIKFSGTVGQVQEALHISIHKYVVKGEEHWANASDPQIPAAPRGWIRLMGWLAFVCLLGVVGCGGGGSQGTADPGTPLGASTVTVTSTSGSISHNVTFTLTVQ
jgi:pro-kumamolisin-like protein